jgi:diguanylate cyclase (GGDEF)-like protein
MPLPVPEPPVLVCAPGLDNGRVIARRLEGAAIGCTVAADAAELAAALAGGADALGAVVVTADAMRRGASVALDAYRRVEPAWSALPVILLAPPGTPGVDAWPHTEALAQPTTARRLIAAVERSLAARRRQRGWARTNEALRALAHRDALTGLANRLALDERIRELQGEGDAPGATHVVLFVDVDDFKSINDAHGHGAGDEALGQVAGFLAGAVRETDLVARWGGDEFVVLLRGASEAEVTEILATLRGGLLVRLSGVDAPRFVSFSVGHVDGLDPELTPMEILRRADARMYERKTPARDGGRG